MFLVYLTFNISLSVCQAWHCFELAGWSILQIKHFAGRLQSVSSADYWVDHSWHISLPFYIYSRDAYTLDTRNNAVDLECRDQLRHEVRQPLIV